MFVRFLSNFFGCSGQCKISVFASRTVRFARHTDKRNVGRVYHRKCSSIKEQTIYIGPVKVVTDPFFLEGVLYIKLTSPVSIPWHIYLYANDLYVT